MSKKLTNADYHEAAKFLNCSVAAIKAVALVESGGRGGFDEKGRVLIRFEGHKFRSFTNGKFDLTYPQVSYRYHRTHRNCGSIHGYTSFNLGMQLDSLAAMKACSIGMFQPMVFNYHEMGYSSPEEMWDDFRKGEREQLLAFCQLIKKWKLDDELRRATLADFTTFARIYNGADFQANNYHRKMFNNYERFKSEVYSFAELNEDEIELDIPQINSAHGTDAVTPPDSLSIIPADSDQTGVQIPVAMTPVEPANPSVPEPTKTETVNAPPKEGSTATAVKTTILGITVPAFVGVAIKSITDLISQGYVSTAQIGEFVLNLIKENQKYVLWIVIAIITLLGDKKLCKQITLWIQMWFAGNKNTNNVEVKPQ